MLAGSCHCGNLEVVFTPGRDPEDLQVRACGCAFCVRHGARTTSDPDGRAEIAIRDEGQLLRYRFGLRTADFLVCRGCGIYLAAVMTDSDGQSYATINVNVLDDRARFALDAVAADYDAEDFLARTARRRARWTPTVFRQAKPPGR